MLRCQFKQFLIEKSTNRVLAQGYCDFAQHGLDTAYTLVVCAGAELQSLFDGIDVLWFITDRVVLLPTDLLVDAWFWDEVAKDFVVIPA